MGALRGQNMKLNTGIALSVMGFLALTAQNNTAKADGALYEAFDKSKLYIDSRYRFETVDQDGFSNTAEASTLRTRVGIKTGSYYGFLITAEIENIVDIGDDRFNSLANGRTQFPVVVDVESTEINQLFLQYNGLPQTVLKVGRQVIVTDNQRFIGHVGWRQNNQTYDAVVATNKSIPGLTLTYGYIDKVHRIFSDKSIVQDGTWDSSSHIVHAKKKFAGFGNLVGYTYLLDFETDSPANSSATYGGYFAGKQMVQGLGFHYHAEYAYQEDYETNPIAYEADYYHFKGGLSYKGFKAIIGYEVLGSDAGLFAFRTPLATGHAFNGWADKFLVTPANGIEDIYVDITYKVKTEGSLSFLNGLLLKAQYHDFKSEFGNTDYGTELGLYAKMPLKRGFYIEAKYADYDADNFATDTEKFTFGLGYKGSFSN